MESKTPSLTRPKPAPALARRAPPCLNSPVRQTRRPASAPPAAPPARGPAPWNARDSVLAEWRGVDLSDLERGMVLAARPVGDWLPEVIQKLGLPQRRAAAEVLRAWNSLVDPTVAAHAQPVGLRNGTLFVRVDSSVWLSEIVRYRRREILDRLQNCFGRQLVAKISFRLG